MPPLISGSPPWVVVLLWLLAAAAGVLLALVCRPVRKAHHRRVDQLAQLDLRLAHLDRRLDDVEHHLIIDRHEDRPWPS